jgi:hypothetical protein
MPNLMSGRIGGISVAPPRLDLCIRNERRTITTSR